MKDTPSQSIPNCLKKYRRTRGLKQQEVAEILGLKSTSMISRWERGVCLPRSPNIFKLAALYRTMVDALFIDQLRVLRDELYQREEQILKDKAEDQNDK